MIGRPVVLAQESLATNGQASEEGLGFAAAGQEGLQVRPGAGQQVGMGMFAPEPGSRIGGSGRTFP
jgi:hypothetical protein